MNNRAVSERRVESRVWRWRWVWRPAAAGRLQFHDKQFGLETMCVGGGQGMAMILERLS